MKNLVNPIFFLAIMSLTFAGYAQKGTKDVTGLGRQGANPEIIELEGTIRSIEQGPCKYTTGRSISGIHLLLVQSDATTNIHLGPTAEVTDFVKDTQGQSLVVKAFRTNRLPENHYIAKELILNDKNFVLRDDNLRPVWAGRYGKEKWRKNRKRRR